MQSTSKYSTVLYCQNIQYRKMLKKEICLNVEGICKTVISLVKSSRPKLN